jgi:serine/threonine protein kinase
MDRLEGLKLGNYHILEQIGQGGMTMVFKALDLVRNETVAVKVLSPYIAQDPKFETRFNREIDLLLELKHPNIVPVLDYGKHNGFAYIVMPFMPRGTLYNRLDGGPLTPQEGVQIVDDIARGLQFAHDHGIVHRDVKPSNVLMSDDGRALLSDFGFAHVIDVSLSLTGSALIGTPAYMSPEQCQGDQLTPSSDQYSMGILLYQLCTGQLPFSGDTPMAVAVQHINEPLPRPRAVNPRIPRDVERVLNSGPRSVMIRWPSLARRSMRRLMPASMRPATSSLSRIDLTSRRGSRSARRSPGQLWGCADSGIRATARRHWRRSCS